MQQVTLITQDKLILNAWYKSANSNKPTVIIFHGNAGHIGTRMPLAHILTQKGFGVLLLEYRGYGGNPGKPSEKGLYLDAEAAMDFLKNELVQPHQVVLFGESLGTGVATEMAARYPHSCALILQSPYTSLAALRQYHYPWLPIKPWDKFDSIKRIPEIHIPLLVVHGLIDKVVPFEQGKTLYTVANEPKQWLLLPNSGHHSLWKSTLYQETLSSFISNNCHV